MKKLFVDQVIRSYFFRRLFLGVFFTLIFVFYSYSKINDKENFDLSLFIFVVLGILVFLIFTVTFFLRSRLKNTLKKQGLTFEDFSNLSEKKKKKFIEETSL